ncbi:MAG: protein kinase [Deltaproteobacteria bacterium]|nr:protein kinase [Deltaproteobacteria bacterium]
MALPVERVGTEVAGRYRITSILGEGGFAVVYRATHTIMGTDLALKVLHPQALQVEGGRERFQRETRIVASLQHPNIVRIFDAGFLEDGAAYAALELLEGESLGELLQRRQRLEAAEAVPILVDVLRALGAAHRRDVVHRDVKPENVFLTWDHEHRSVAKVLDFGIAYAVESGTRKVTQEGMLVGSPLYMSPEQIHGEDVSAKTDLWATGVVLFEVLTGRVPFDGESIVQIFHRVVHEAPPRLDVPVPRELERALLRALAKDPRDRFPDAEAMLTALQAAMAGQPVRSVPPKATVVPPSRAAVTQEAPVDLFSFPEPDAPAAFAEDLDALVAQARTRPAAVDFDFGDPGAPDVARAPTEPLAELPALDDFLSAPGEPRATPASEELFPAAFPEPSTAPADDFQVAPGYSSEGSFGGSGRASEVHTALAPEVIDRSRAVVVRRARGPSAWWFVLLVVCITAGGGYLARPIIERAFRSDAQQQVDEVRELAATEPDPVEPDDAGTATARPVEDPQPEPWPFGEQRHLDLPAGLGGVTANDFVTRLDAPGRGGGGALTFVSCTHEGLVLHVGGTAGSFRTVAARAVCGPFALSLGDDLDGDRVPDLVALDERRPGVVTVTSRRWTEGRRVSLPGARAVLGGLTLGRNDPGALVYTHSEGPAQLVAVNLRNGRVAWRSDPLILLGDPQDHGLAVGPDLDGDRAPDVAVGTVGDGQRCVEVLSGATGLRRWPRPVCHETAAATSLSVGPDVNGDGKAEVLLGRVGSTPRLLSGADGRVLHEYPGDPVRAGTTYGWPVLLVPALHGEGTPTVVIGDTGCASPGVDVLRATDGFRFARLPLPQGTSSPLFQVRLLTDFLQGHRSLLLATPVGGISIQGTGSRR